MDYTIYILAQGNSTRMGLDKGLVKLASKEMVAHSIDNLKSLQKEIIIITDNEDYKKFGYSIISDKIKNNGPAQGILTALEHSQTEKNLIISCDMPLVNDLMIRQFDELIMAEVLCYKEDYLFPFPGMYSKGIVPKWRTLVNEGEHKMQHLIKQFDYKTLPIEHPELFLNVNTPEDILKAEEILNK